MKEFNNSYVGIRLDLLKFIVKGSNNVLDVGCATGVNGDYLLKNNFASLVYGIEFNNNMALEASKKNTKVFCGDLNSTDFIFEVNRQNVKFDYIIFGDILEHLNDPLNALIELKKMLKDDGKIIISLPNIAHIELFIQVYIHGTWPKNERGIFDKTHLRWFTKKDVHQLAENAKLMIITYEPSYRFRDSIGSKSSIFFKVFKFFRKELVTFQHIVVCEK